MGKSLKTWSLTKICGQEMAGEKITEGEMEDFIAKHKLAVIDFSAEWCPPCTFLDKVVEEILPKYKQKDVGFAEIDVDENKQIAMELGISSIPSIFFFKDGQMCVFADDSGNQHDRIVGALNKKQLTNLLDLLLEEDK